MITALSRQALPLSPQRNAAPSKATSTASADTFVRAADQNWQDAGALMAGKGIPAEQHEFMQENLATALAHRNDGQSLRRWQVKIDRELASPYTDSQVLERVDALQESLKENLKQLSYPGKVYLTGSFAKGTMGANSNLDGYAVVDSAKVADSAKTFQARRAEGSSNLFPLDESSPGYNRAMLMVDGSTVSVAPEQLEQDGFLRKAYQQVLETRPAERQQNIPSLDWATGKIWRSKFDHQSLKSRAVGWALHAGGAASTLPLLGSLLEKAAGKVVAQHHISA